MSILKAYSLPPMNCTCTLAKIVSVISRQSAAPLAHSVLQPLTLLRWAVGVPSILRSTHSCAQLRLVRVLLSLSKAFPKSLGVFQLLPLSFCKLMSWCCDHWDSRHEKDPSAYFKLYFCMELTIPVKNITPFLEFLLMSTVQRLPGLTH